ncbi:MAG: GNAT family N-acetyltransferase [archaeon]
MMEIKPIKEEDTKKFRQSWEESDKEKSISPEIKRLYLGAFIGNELVGYMKIKFRGGVGNLSSLIVQKNMRKKGIGRTLLNHFENISKEHSCHKLTLRTSENHHTALSLYKNSGYVIEATFKNDKDHITWYQLCKHTI